MSTASIQQFCEALYCTVAPWEAFVQDSAHRISFTAFDAAGGVLRLYHVEFVGVHDFRWQEANEPPRSSAMPRPIADARLELSELELEWEGDAWRFWCNPWYSRTIEFECEQIRLNNAVVSGRGKWLQDSLPASDPDVPSYTGDMPASIEAILDIPRAG